MEWLAVATSVGVSYSDFLELTPAGLAAVSHGYHKRVDMEAWLTGRYVHEALSAVLSAAFGKKGHTPYKYPAQPYSVQEDVQTPKDEDREALRAKIYMRQMMRVGKNWGKKSD